MFARMHANKAAGKRPPSASDEHPRPTQATLGTTMHNGRPDVAGDSGVRPAAVAPTPRPLLPPIPRVASQYGAHGPVSMSELERTLRSFSVDEEEASQHRSNVNERYYPKTRLETIRDTEARLTGAPQSQETAPTHPPVSKAVTRRPRAASNNFSRPLPPAASAPAAGPAAQDRRTTATPFTSTSTVRLVPNTSPPSVGRSQLIKVPHPDAALFPQDAPAREAMPPPHPVTLPSPPDARPMAQMPLPHRSDVMLDAQETKPAAMKASARLPLPSEPRYAQPPGSMPPPPRPTTFAPVPAAVGNLTTTPNTNSAIAPPLVSASAASRSTVLGSSRPAVPTEMLPPASSLPAGSFHDSASAQRSSHIHASPAQNRPVPSASAASMTSAANLAYGPPLQQQSPFPLPRHEYDAQIPRPQTAPADHKQSSFPLTHAANLHLADAAEPQRPSSRGHPLFRPVSKDGPAFNQHHDGSAYLAYQQPGFMSMQAESLVREPSGPRPSSAKWSSSDSAASTVAPPTTLGHSKTGKTGRSRFNPMSLISRRKSGQPTRPVPVEHFPPPLPADFDPRIRGKVVHDFSAPRPRPAAAVIPTRQSIRPDPGRQQVQSTEQGATSGEALLPKKPHPTAPRVPMFKEHFGDDTEGWRLDERDPRNHDTTGIADRVPERVPEQTLSSLPVFARRTPSSIAAGPPVAPPQGPLPPTPRAQPLVPQITTPEKEIAQHVGLTQASEKASPEPEQKVEPDLPHTPSRSSPSGSSKFLSPTPARLKSNASSRFSFDLAGVGSVAQEKLLEEKHRQRYAQKARESVTSGISMVETDDEDNGYDDMDMDGGFEEDFPGMGSDDDDFPHAGNVADFVLPSSDPSAKPPSSLANTAFNLSQPLQVEEPPQASSSPSHIEPIPASATNQGSIPSVEVSNYQSRLREAEQRLHQGNFVDDDELYFDDGMIDGLEHGNNEPFDESVFDDENSTIYGIPLRDQHKLEAPAEAMHSDSSQPSTRPMSFESAALAAHNAKATADTSRTSVQPVDKIHNVRNAPVLGTIHQGTFDATAGLTKDNLAAYHDALAFAANKAAQEGRFDRKLSMDEASSMNGSTLRPHASFKEYGGEVGVHAMDEEAVTFDFDDHDDQDDDAIIAEANAEALENDDEGFYGQEFGFYAQSNGDAERVHGGYFGGAFSDMVKRSHSGKAKDPSLTPITERSEWSQRNSMISLAMQQGGSYTAAATPGLAQLAAESGSYDDDNMSLSALMKLRRGAFGDSSTSLPSSAGSHKSSSPQGLMFPAPPVLAPAPHPGLTASRTNSSGTVPLTAAAAAAAAAMPPPPLPPLRSGAHSASPIRRPLSSRSHSRNSSGAESVSYVMERDDEGGSGRWIMERRRASEAGEVEVLGRQVLERQRT